MSNRIHHLRHPRLVLHQQGLADDELRRQQSVLKQRMAHNSDDGDITVFPSVDVLMEER